MLESGCVYLLPESLQEHGAAWCGAVDTVLPCARAAGSRAVAVNVSEGQADSEVKGSAV